MLVAHELGPMAPLVDRAVVLAHGVVSYDGEPLDEVTLHAHHHPRLHRHDHTPHVGSPIDSLQERR